MSLPVRPSSNAALKAFAEQLGPLPAARAFGHREVQKVFEAIKTCSDNIFYDRIRIMGGDEQKTSCWATLDFDCVAFVNVDEQFWRSPTGLEQKLDDLQARVINSWKLNLARQLPGVVVSFPEDQKCKLEWIDYGFTADLLVGVNALTQKDRENLAASKGKSLADIQSERIMLAVANLSSNHTERKRIATKLIISASVMERSAYLMEHKSALAHEVARMAKIWVLMNAKGKKKGASSLISLIASDCDTNTNLLDAFTKFLLSLTMWRSISIDSSLDLGIPKQQKHRKRPKVVDPGNQFDNYFPTEGNHDMSYMSYMGTLKKKSVRTLEKLNDITHDWDMAAIADLFFLERYPRLDKRLFKTVVFEITSSNNQALFPRIEVGIKGRKHRFIAQVFLLIKIAASFVSRLNCDGSGYRDSKSIANDLKMLLTTRLDATFVSSISSQQKKDKTQMRFLLPVASKESSLVIEGFV